MSCPHIKSEVKTEEEDLISRTGGFLCPACGEQLFCEKYFIEHIRERHYKPDLQVQEQEEEQSLFSDFTKGSVYKNGYVTEQDGCCVQNKCDVLKSEVKTEKSEINGVSGGFLCSVCGEKFLEENSFIKHIKDHVENSGKRKRPKCDEFQNDSDNIRSLVSGIRNRSDSGCIPLETCNPEEKIRANLRYNVKFHSGEKPFKCPDCAYATARKSHLKVHTMTHSGEKPFKCPDCSYATTRKSNLKVHTMTHSGEKPFKCPDCSYATARKSDLKVHTMTHYGEKPLKCPDCSYGTVNKSNFKVHLFTHSGDKPFKCSDCSYATVQKSNLKVHMKTHSGDKPFKCPDCLFATARKSYLKVHMRVHSGEKPFKCPDCSYGTSNKSNFKVHLKTHSGEKPFK